MKEEPVEESESEAALFAYMSGDREGQPSQRPGSRRGKVLLVSAIAVACVVLVAVPRSRRILQMFYRGTAHAAANLLNPPPAPLPQAVAQHDSFGQEGDEYKLPATGNIPDATTDPSQIRVLPVIDPTAKTEKSPETNGGPAQATAGESNAAADQSQADQSRPGQDQNRQAQAGQDPIKDSTQTSAGNVPGSSTGASPGAAPTAAQAQPNAPVVRAAVPQPRLVPSTVRSFAPPHARFGSEQHGHSVESEIANGFLDPGCQREQARRGGDVSD